MDQNANQTEYRAKTRLYLQSDLTPGANVALHPDQSHYLQKVMRLNAGEKIYIFNGKDGEYVADFDGKSGLRILSQTRMQTTPAELGLMFAPIKKDGTDFILQKAAELGASFIQPVFTDYSNTSRFNLDRANANIIEASEQCRRLTIPDLRDAAPLSQILDSWPAGAKLIYCDEMRDCPPVADVLRQLAGSKIVFLTGPEGGFSAAERTRLQTLPFAHGAHLGPRILRAETAAIACLAAHQLLNGDWSQAN